MELKFKKDFGETKKYWNAFWEGEVIDRPLIITNFPKDEKNKFAYPSYLSGMDGNFEKVIEEFENYCENTSFFAESIPSLNISFGPDTISYFIKAEKNVNVESKTAWIEPFVKNWEDFKTIEIDRKNIWYKRFMDFYKFAGEKGKGKFLLQMPDFHTHLDLLRAIRGSENLCIDLIERPYEIKNKLEQIKDFFKDIYNEILNLSGMEKLGTTSWIRFYSEKKYSAIECDFICMISNEMFKEFALPYIEYEAEFLDNSIFHLDGPGALRHLEDLLSIKKIDAIQWVPGAGNPPHIKWIEMFKKIKSKGKKIVIYPDSFEEIKIFHKELGPEGIVYEFYWVKNLKQAEGIKKWLIKNT